MVLDSFGPHLVRHTVDEGEAVLNRWIAWLRSDPFLAFGDEPAPVYEIEADLKRLLLSIYKLRLVFDRANADADAVSTYRAVHDTCHAAAELVARIRERNRGTPDCTRKIVQLLVECRGQLRALPPLFEERRQILRTIAIGE